MRNSIKADTKRVLEKKTYIGFTLVCILILLIGGLLVAVKGPDYLGLFLLGARGITGIIMGITIFRAIYSDDFTSRAMQTAIGFGLSRAKLVLCRFIETIIVYVQTYVVFSILIFIVAKVGGYGANDAMQAIVGFWESVLIQLCYCGISLIIVYAMQNAGVALIVFILFVSGTVSTVLQTLTMVPFFAEHNIAPQSILAGDLVTSHEPVKILIAIVCYIGISLLITVNVFKRKELEF